MENEGTNTKTEVYTPNTQTPFTPHHKSRVPPTRLQNRSRSKTEDTKGDKKRRWQRTQRQVNCHHLFPFEASNRVCRMQWRGRECGGPISPPLAKPLTSLGKSHDDTGVEREVTDKRVQTAAQSIYVRHKSLLELSGRSRLHSCRSRTDNQKDATRVPDSNYLWMSKCDHPC